MNHPRVIWLQPWCDECEQHGGSEGRLWCQDDVWGKCEKCGRKAIRYVFDDVVKAVQWLEGRGYALTENHNWLPPNNITEPSSTDRAAADYLAAYSDYGGIIKLTPCPFCGGRPDAHGPLGVKCLDCGAIAIDIIQWQRRVGPASR